MHCACRHLTIDTYVNILVSLDMNVSVGDNYINFFFFLFFVLGKNHCLLLLVSLLLLLHYMNMLIKGGKKIWSILELLSSKRSCIYWLNLSSFMFSILMQGQVLQSNMELGQFLVSSARTVSKLVILLLKIR